jgi:hypothetical protein
MDAIYAIDGNSIVTGPNAAGPWDGTMQHGSAPSALITWIAEQMPTPSPMQVVRVTADLLRPVPVKPLTFETELLREGRKIQLCGVTLKADGTVVARGTVLKIRVAQPQLPDGIDSPAVTLPSVDASPEIAPRGRNPFVSGLTLRSAHGSFETPGPGAIWFRMNREFIAGQPLSPVMRAVIASDFSNGTSSLLDFRKYTFLNADLSVSLSRPPVGEWILLDAESWIGPDGAGLAAARLADSQGYFGRAVQSLVIEPR